MYTSVTPQRDYHAFNCILCISIVLTEVKAYRVRSVRSWPAFGRHVLAGGSRAPWVSVLRTTTTTSKASLGASFHCGRMPRPLTHVIISTVHARASASDVILSVCFIICSHFYARYCSLEHTSGGRILHV